MTNLTGISAFVEMALPSSVAGLNFHLSSASVAGFSKTGSLYFTTTVSTTSPCSSMVQRTVTSPEMPWRCISSGYSGATVLTGTGGSRVSARAAGSTMRKQTIEMNAQNDFIGIFFEPFTLIGTRTWNLKQCGPLRGKRCVNTSPAGSCPTHPPGVHGDPELSCAGENTSEYLNTPQSLL